MNGRDLQHLFSYNDWANREVLRVLKLNSTARSRKLFAHLLSAERLWFERLEQAPQTQPVWPEATVEQLEKQAADLAASWKRRLGGNADLERQVAYKNTKGESWNNREDDILLHVILHSAYHRGQIAADLRANGIAPPYTDFIAGVRQGLVE